MANFKISLTNKNRTRPALCVFRQRQTVNIKLATVAEECKFGTNIFLCQILFPFYQAAETGEILPEVNLSKEAEVRWLLGHCPAQPLPFLLVITDYMSLGVSEGTGDQLLTASML